MCPFSNIATYIAKGAHLTSKHYLLFWSLKKVCPFSIHSLLYSFLIDISRSWLSIMSNSFTTSPKNPLQVLEYHYRSGLPSRYQKNNSREEQIWNKLCDGLEANTEPFCLFCFLIKYCPQTLFHVYAKYFKITIRNTNVRILPINLDVKTRLLVLHWVLGASQEETNVTCPDYHPHKC